MTNRTSAKSASINPVNKPGSSKSMTKSEYKFSLLMNGDTYEGEGNTPLEALQAVPKPYKLTAKAVLTYTHGDYTKSLLFFPNKLRRVFYPNAQPVLVKWLAMET